MGEECNNTLVYEGQITQEMLCREHRVDSSVCQEDAGSPLMCLNNNRWELQGVLSAGGGCSQEGKEVSPSVFTSIPALREWIDTVMETGQ